MPRDTLDLAVLGANVLHKAHGVNYSLVKGLRYITPQKPHRRKDHAYAVARQSEAHVFVLFGVLQGSWDNDYCRVVPKAKRLEAYIRILFIIHVRQAQHLTLDRRRPGHRKVHNSSLLADELLLLLKCLYESAPFGQVQNHEHQYK